MSREELTARIAELEAQLRSEDDLRDLVEQMHAGQEEIRAQQQELISAQRDLEVSRDRYAQLYDFSPVPILSLDDSGTIEEVNLAASRLLGVARASLMGTPFVVYVEPKCRKAFLDHMVHCRASQQAMTQLQVKTVAGALVPVEMMSRHFRPTEASPVLYLSAVLDLTERTRAEEEHARAVAERERGLREEMEVRAASEAKDRFLAVLSHELRTPLAPIMLGLELLERIPKDASQMAAVLGMIRRNLEVEKRLIDDLLDLTVIVRGKLSLNREPIDLHSAIRHVVEMCADDIERSGVVVELALEAERPFVEGDGTRLCQVFWNVIKNALRHTPAAGRVLVRSQDLPAGRLLATVGDTGEGIDASELPRIFEPFQRSESRSPRGGALGLGLAISRGLVEAHQGRLEAESEGRGRGALFRIELPSCDPPRPVEPLPSEEMRHRRLRVLIVEDHVDTAAALEYILRKLGYTVCVAHSLDDGRTMAREAFDVLVSDINLPDGSGLDLMRELCALRSVKGIALSGFGAERDVQQSLEAGFRRHLVKPISAQQIVEAIESLVA